jgi:hypothetical protein
MSSIPFRQITSLPWEHFLSRLYYFKRPEEKDYEFLNRATISKPTKSMWLNHIDPKPNTTTIERIAKALNLTKAEMFWLTFGKTLEELRSLDLNE